MNILVHICCAPCFTYPHPRLLEEEHEITGFFYNPNIHPFLEYKKRFQTLQNYAHKQDVEIIYKDEYDLKMFLEGAITSENRCEFCYTCRLKEAAKTAKEEGFDAFTTTLLVSPYQKHDLLKVIGEKVGNENNILFYYEDFRVGWKKTKEISKNLELYRQKYCGCIFSEMDRYYKKLVK
ncbi:MAG: epoxyqueuosine reductase QueH [Methanosarcinales archaeon]